MPDDVSSRAAAVSPPSSAAAAAAHPGHHRRQRPHHDVVDVVAGDLRQERTGPRSSAHRPGGVGFQYASGPRPGFHYARPVSLDQRVGPGI